MRRALIWSFLVHATVVTTVFVTIPGRATAPRPAFVSSLPAPAPEPEPPAPEPRLPDAPPPVPEEWEPEEAEPEDAAVFDVVPVRRSPSPDAVPLVSRTKIARPLRRAAPPPPPVVAAPSSPSNPVPAAAHAPTSPQKQRCPAPRYPKLARRLGQEGTVVLRLSIDATGAVTDVAIETSSGHPMLDRAAAAAAHDWHFEPATRNGRPIADDLLQPVEFRLELE